MLVVAILAVAILISGGVISSTKNGTAGVLSATGGAMLGLVPPPLVVNTTDDLNDGACDVTHCSLREAINAANASGDVDTIDFNIPTGDLGFDGSVFTIKPTSALPTVRSNVTIDGSSQDTFGANTNPNGPDVVVNGSLAGTVSGFFINGDNSTIKALVVNGFAGGGISIGYQVGNDLNPSSNQILNNYVGTNAAGTGAVPNGSGISIGGYGSPGTTANGNTVQGNLISGNTGTGVGTCDISNTTISNNKIGTNAAGTGALGNSGHGINFQCTGALNNTISGNTIAFNDGDGLRSTPDYRFGDLHHGNKITQSSFFSNTGLGINLLPPPFGTIDGVTPNDAGDPDNSANNLQNFPVITQAYAVGAGNSILGTLNSTPAQTFTIEFFSNSSCDPSGNGEGQTYLGSVDTTTDATGDGVFTFHPATLNAGEFVTATATDASGNTSEFSACFTAVAGVANQLQFVRSAYSTTETNSGTHDVTVTVLRLGGTTGAISVHYATSNGNATILDNDYDQASDTLSWADGDGADKTFNVTIHGDLNVEPAETVNLALSAPSANAALGSPTAAVLTIVNDDAPPAVLGNYPDSTLSLGVGGVISPDAVPSSVASASASANGKFKGTLTIDLASGNLRVTNPQPAGTYQVTITGFNAYGLTTTKTFTLTVANTAGSCGALVFTSQPDLTSLSNPYNLAVGDFNGDGKQDVAVANIGANSVSIRLGDGAGGFTTKPDVSVGSSPIAVAVGDFNGDGKQDLAVTNVNSNNVSIRLGDGAGNFTGSTTVGTGSSPYSVAIGDFNSDGKQDLAVANASSNTVSIRLGDGAGNFTGSTEVSSGSSTPLSVAIADFNNDGKSDLAIANINSNVVGISLGDGLGNFSSTTTVVVGSQPAAVAVGDFNNDGQQDLAASNRSSNTVSIRMGDGAGNFSGTTDVSVGSLPWDVTVGDLNNDGNQDFAAVNQNSATVSVRFGNGAGAFSGTTELTVGSNAQYLVLADFNGDARLDLAVSNVGSSTVSIKLNICPLPPTLGNYSNQTVSLGSNTNVSPDAAPANVVAIEATAPADFKGTFAVSPSTGALEVVNAQPAGTYPVTVTAFNVAGAMVSKTFTLTVANTAGSCETLLFTRPDLTSLNNPYNLAVGDFNGDGKQDVAVVNIGANSVSIRLGDGTGGFTTTPDVSVGSSPIGIAVGDFNGDGKQDLAVNNASSNTVSIRLGDGTGNFSGSTTVGTGSTPYSVAVGDFNSDGKQDLAVANVSSNSVSIRLGDGAGQFTGSTEVSSGGSAPFSVALADFNDDGKSDLAIANFNSNVVGISLGDGLGNFSGTTTVTVGSQPAAVAVGDFNNDGQQDLAASNQNSHTVSIRMGDGAGNFSGTTDVSVGSYPWGVAVGDINNDGNQDFAAANQSSATVSVRFGNGAGAFTGTTELTVGSNPRNPALADFNGDARLDLAVPNQSSNTASIKLNICPLPPTLGNYSNQTVSLGSNTNVTPDAAPANVVAVEAITPANFKGTFAVSPSTGALEVVNAQPVGTYSVTVTAFNVAGAMVSKTFTLTVANTAGSCGGVLFTSKPDLTSLSNPYNLAVGDFNGDGKQDLAVANAGANSVSIRLGDGTGGFTTKPDVSVGSTPVGIAVGDFNSDGKQDLAVANAGSNNVSIRLGDGTGNFSGSTTVGTGSTPYSVAVGDFNSDGKQDLAVANAGSNTVSIRLGDGAGNFTGSTEVSSGGSAPFSVALADFNNDGKSDLAIANISSNVVGISLGDGLGNFSGTTTVVVGSNPRAVAVGDFNNDGKQDLAASNQNSNTVSIRLGDGAGNFSGTTDVSVGTNPGGVAVGDINNDGNQDFAAANQSSATVSVRFGNGAGAFTGTTELTVGSNPLQPALADFNGDARLDLAVPNAGSSTVSIILNGCPGTIQFAAANTDDDETNSGTHTVNIAVKRVNGSDGPVSVNYLIANDTATIADNDYSVGSASGMLSWGNGDTADKLITITVKGDTKFENHEQVNLSLNTPGGGAVLGAQTTATLTIKNDDSQPSLSINDVSHDEGNGSTTAYTFTISLSNPSSQTVTVKYATVDGTATAPEDYAAVALTTVTFDPLETSKQITVNVSGDTTYEANETFTVHLSEPGNATIADADGLGTITNDDAPPATLVVNATADTDDGLCSTDPAGCTLREAINAANFSSDTSTINFDSTVFAAPGPYTINLTSVLPDLSSGMTINGSGANVLTIQRSTVDGTPDFRIFTVNTSQPVSISGLTVTNGSETNGGGILNSGAGTLTLSNSTVSGNTAQLGGGIANVGGTGTVTVINSTISGNSANHAGGIFTNNFNPLNLINSTISGNSATMNGGGIYNQGTTSTTNCTITNNRADDDGNGTGAGGGIYRDAGTVTLRNTIVAGNFNEDGPSDAADDIGGTVDTGSSFNNLIGDGGAGGLQNAVNGNKQVSDPRLGPLANNGGPTQTHALLVGSLALDAGSNTFITNPPFIGSAPFTDQRGAGFKRILDAADVNDTTQTVDIGAYEANPMIMEFPDLTFDEDFSSACTGYAVGDDTEGFSSIVGTSSNQSLLKDSNLDANVPNQPGSRCLAFTLEPNQFGTATITITVTGNNGRTISDSFLLTVNSVNDPPTLTLNTGVTVNEGSSGNTIGSAKLKVSDVDNTDAQLTFTVGTAPARGTLKKSGSGLVSGGTFTQADINNNLLTYDHDGGETTSDSFTFTVSDGAGGSIGSTTFNIAVTPVNDPPTLTTNAGLSVFSGATGTIDNTKLSVSDADNTPSQLVFTVGTTPTHGALIRGGIALAGGNTFTQLDVNNNLIAYAHNGDTASSDSFTFTVSDGAGGTIGTTTFNISIGCVTNPVVTNTNDSGPGSLRDGILTACPGNNITFNIPTSDPGFSGGAYFITLTSGEMVINKNLTITGLGANLLSVRRSSAVGLPNFRIFDVQSGHTVNISALTIANGSLPNSVGGNVFNNGTLTLSNCTVSGGSTGFGIGTGGGIFNNSGATLTLTNCMMSLNSANGGGAIMNIGALTLTNSTLSGNVANTGGGGAIYNNGPLTLVNSTLSGNLAQGAGAGGGIFNSSTGTASLTNSTVNGNIAGNGAGGVFNGGALALTNSTVSGNSSSSNSGGIYNGAGVLTLTNVTVTNNRSDSNDSGGEPGGGIFRSAGTVTLKNTIVAGNFRGTGSTRDDINGTIDATTSSFNLIGDGTNLIGISNGSNGNQIGTSGSPLNAMLGVLASNGGATQTHLLLPGSSAINAGSNANLPADAFDLDGDSNTTEPLPLDQRGTGFPRIINSTVDIGAVEYTKVDQTITFGSLPDKTFGNPPFNVGATASSGLPVSFSILSGPATISGNTVTINGAGAVTVRASQAGDTNNYNAAAPVDQSFTVNKANQTITFGALANKTFGNPDFAVSATSDSGFDVSLASSGNCSVTSPSPGTVHITAAGPCTITASQGGDSNYFAASPVARSFDIGKAATTTTVSSSVNPSEFGESVTFTATVIASVGTPTGTVQFMDGANNLGSAVNCAAGGGNNCTAQVSTSNLTTGPHTISATYSGDANFLTSSGSLSAGQGVKAQPTLSINDVSMAEGNSGTTSFVFTLTLSSASNLTVNVNYTTANGTATVADSDYQAAASTLTFNPGDLTKTITVLVNGDQKFEPDETFLVNLSSAVNAAISDNQGFGTILNEDTLQLLLDTSGPDANQAAALDSILLVRDPFRVLSIAEWFDLGSDRNTRVIVFAANLQLNPGEQASDVKVNLVGSDNHSYDLDAEDVTLLPSVQLTQIRFRLPNDLANGVCLVTVRAQGRISNTGTIRIAP